LFSGKGEEAAYHRPNGMNGTMKRLTRFVERAEDFGLAARSRKKLG
jgi:hypothetical protein